MFLIILFLLITPMTVSADLVCKTVDLSQATLDQKRRLFGALYRIAYEDGNQNIQPQISNNQICFDSPTFNVSTLITKQNILNKIEDDVQKDTDERARIIQKKKDLKDKLKGLGLTDEEIKYLKEDL